MNPFLHGDPDILPANIDDGASGTVRRACDRKTALLQRFHKRIQYSERAVSRFPRHMNVETAL
jgi:hypothetical protein